MTDRTALLVDATALATRDAAGTCALRPGVAAAVARMQVAGVPVVALDFSAAQPDPQAEVVALLQAAHAPLAGWMRPAADAPPAWRLPRPGLVLAAARAHGVDLATSWLVSPAPDALRAAAQAGCYGAVLIGVTELPADLSEAELAIVTARADDLADAPRVMVPRQGGCWHAH